MYRHFTTVYSKTPLPNDIKVDFNIGSIKNMVLVPLLSIINEKISGINLFSLRLVRCM